MNGGEDIHELIVRPIEREIAAMEAADAAVEEALSARPRRQKGSSLVYSLRLDPGEVSALQRRAAQLGIKPSVLARNLVREGLSKGCLAPEESSVGSVEW
jgi:hypothetical protein